MPSTRPFGFLAALLVLTGCDPNPNGPSAPSAPPASEPGQEAPGDPKEKVPLKRVGQPIGMIRSGETSLQRAIDSVNFEA
jgi:hypothetical protein